jgi:predicted nucleotidyltransferase
MADIEPSIQFESLYDRIDIFSIKQILTNINSLVNDLNSQPRVQNLLAAAVTKGINRQLCSQITNRTIKRERLTQGELFWITQWMIINHSPVRSGTEIRQELQFQTLQKAHKSYGESTRNIGQFAVRSESFLLQLVHSLNVRFPTFKYYPCPICSSGVKT